MTAESVARLIETGFEEYREQFRAVTHLARHRFEQEDWIGIQEASVARIKLYATCTAKLVDTILEPGPAGVPGLEDWASVKRHYARLIRGKKDYELAETVYNTVFRKLFAREHLRDEYAFVTESLAQPATGDANLLTGIGPTQDLRQALTNLLTFFEFDVPWADLDADVELMVSTMKASVPLLRYPQELRFEMLRAVFYRNKGAYLIGRMYIGEHLFPLAIPIHNRDSALFVDTIIWNDDDLSIIFSFTRSYFMVDIDYPREMVDFLQELLPNKKRWELYTSLGFYKHGKTEFYRDFLQHLAQSTDQFILAEGIKGLVMSVFTLPSYQSVFKVIRDRFAPTKKVTRDQVRAAYYLVKTHDRVGRMADTQEFSNFRFPRHRFSQALLDELQKTCASSITLSDDEVLISHLYTERRMTPLNIYLEQASEFEQRQVLDEYGNAIRQLAAANIFPGDMLLKNFGVTRHRRVVFYDYDEICYLTEVNFREIPPPRDREDQLAAEPWYSVGPYDVFPEEFENFLFNSDHLREEFRANHGDLFTVAYWQGIQQKIRDHQVMDVYPYRRRRSFRRELA
ncbi:MAG: bifunctional isocitrate dehydrogenase kinase/phosphatase [Pseudomonadota bacterium]